MILAHLPSGYLLARASGHRRGVMLMAALLGAVIPDFDMIWFHLVDQSRHHHRFWPHIPAVWAVISLITLPLMHRLRTAWFAPMAIALAGVGLHLLLDTWAGGVLWLWPLSDHLFELITVPASQSHWLLSFALHWSFGAEDVLVLAAIVIYIAPERP